MGYASPRINTTKHTITERRRKIKGYEVFYPDGGSRICDTLKEAKAYVDSYMGEGNHDTAS